MSDRISAQPGVTGGEVVLPPATATGRDGMAAIPDAVIHNDGVRAIKCLSELPRTTSSLMEVADLAASDGSVQAVSFDFIRTLAVWSSGLHERRESLHVTALKVLRSYGINVDMALYKSEYKASRRRMMEDLDPMYMDFKISDAFRDTISNIIVRLGLDSESFDVDRIARALEEVVYSIKYESISGMAEAKEALDKIKKAGKKVVVYSNAYYSQEHIEECMRRLGLIENIDYVFSSCEIGARKDASSPVGFLKVAREIGIDPENILHVGDSYDADYEGAVNAGLKGIHLDKSSEENGLLFDNIPHKSREYALSVMHFERSQLARNMHATAGVSELLEKSYVFGQDVLGPCIVKICHDVLSQASVSQRAICCSGDYADIQAQVFRSLISERPHLYPDVSQDMIMVGTSVAEDALIIDSSSWTSSIGTTLHIEEFDRHAMMMGFAGAVRLFTRWERIAGVLNDADAATPLSSFADRYSSIDEYVRDSDYKIAEVYNEVVPVRQAYNDAPEALRGIVSYDDFDIFFEPDAYTITVHSQAQFDQLIAVSQGSGKMKRRIRRLVATGPAINSLVGIGALDSLREIDLSGSVVSDVSELAQCLKLRKVNLFDCSVDNFDALRQHEGMRVTDVHGVVLRDEALKYVGHMADVGLNVQAMTDRVGLADLFPSTSGAMADLLTELLPDNFDLLPDPVKLKITRAVGVLHGVNNCIDVNKDLGTRGMGWEACLKISAEQTVAEINSDALAGDIHSGYDYRRLCHGLWVEVDRGVVDPLVAAIIAVRFHGNMEERQLVELGRMFPPKDGVESERQWMGRWYIVQQNPSISGFDTAGAWSCKQTALDLFKITRVLNLSASCRDLSPEDVAVLASNSLDSIRNCDTRQKCAELIFQLAYEQDPSTGKVLCAPPRAAKSLVFVYGPKIKYDPASCIEDSDQSITIKVGDKVFRRCVPIGRGNVAEVYKGFDDEGRPVAIKIYMESFDSMSKVEDEVMVLAEGCQIPGQSRNSHLGQFVDDANSHEIFTRDKDEPNLVQLGRSKHAPSLIACGVFGKSRPGNDFSRRPVVVKDFVAGIVPRKLMKEVSKHQVDAPDSVKAVLILMLKEWLDIINEMWLHGVYNPDMKGDNFMIDCDLTDGFRDPKLVEASWKMVVADWGLRLQKINGGQMSKNTYEKLLFKGVTNVGIPGVGSVMKTALEYAGRAIVSNPGGVFDDLRGPMEAIKGVISRAEQSPETDFKVELEAQFAKINTISESLGLEARLKYPL